VFSPLTESGIIIIPRFKTPGPQKEDRKSAVLSRVFEVIREFGFNLVQRICALLRYQVF